MKKAVRISLNLLMAGFILASSSGLFLNKMVCVMSGNTMFSLTPFEKCSGETKKEGITDACCDFSQVLLKMKIDANRTQPAPAIDLVPIEFFSYAIKVPVADFGHDMVIGFTDLPPPKPSDTYLALIQVYLI